MTHDMRVELLTAAGPVQVPPGDVLYGVRVREGRQPEASAADPTRAVYSLRDDTGRYDPTNPGSDLYGLIGRGTPITTTVRPDTSGWPDVDDAFSRTVAEGWGTPDSGPAWTTVSSGGTFLGTDLSVSSGSGRITVTSAGSWRAAQLGGGLNTEHADCDVTAYVTAPVATGGPIETDIMLRSASGTGVGGGWQHRTMARVETHPDGTVEASARIVDHFGEREVDASVVDGLTHTGQQLGIRVRLAGRMLAVKVWDATDDEPETWTAVWFLSVLGGHRGFVALRSGRPIGNTNTGLTVLWDDVSVRVRSPRAVTEVQEWPVPADPSGALPVVELDTAGPLARLARAGDPVRAPLATTLAAEARRPGTTLVAYWPMDEGQTLMGPGASWASDSPGSVTPMRVSSGQTSASLTAASAGSGALPVLGSAFASAVIDTVASGSMTEVTGFATLYLPEQDLSISPILLFETTTLQFAVFVTISGGNAQYTVGVTDNVGNPLVVTSTSAAFTAGNFFRISLRLTQSGSDVSWALSSYEQFAPAAFTYRSGTLTGRSVGSWRVAGAFGGGPTPVGVGHIALYNAAVTIFDAYLAFNGHNSENPADRFNRICTEAAIPHVTSVRAKTTKRLGVQPTGTVLDIIKDAVAFDGFVVDDRRTGALRHVHASDVYDHGGTALNLDWQTAGHVPTGMKVSVDPQTFRNRVAVTRPGAETIRREITTGPLSVSPPPTGAGPTPAAATLNLRLADQTPGHVAWLLAVATAQSPRPAGLRTLMHSAPDDVVEVAQALDTGTLIGIGSVPARVARDGAIRGLVVGREEYVAATEWTIGWVLSAAAPWVDVMRIGDDISSRVSGADVSSLASSVTATATSLSVVTEYGLLWESDPAELPYTVQIDGEPVVVTAVSGASSPQTFTVTRDAAYGVPHAAGARVSLWRPGIIAR